MPIPPSTARGLTLAALGAFAALAASANLSPVAAGSMQDRDMHHHQAGMAMDHHATFSFGVPGKPAAVDRTIRIKALDMSFDPPAVGVRPGETVRFVVSNVSAVDHDFTLGNSKTQEEHRKEMAAMTDMAAAHAHQDPNAVFLEGRATKELVWRFGKAGQIEFGCNVPGHYEAGMKGTITIK
jgi:uncharacterized cupredoxin-like copper-binding protein